MHFLLSIVSSLLPSDADILSRAGNMAQESWMKSPSIRFMEEPVASSHWCGRFVETKPLPVPAPKLLAIFVFQTPTEDLGIRFGCRRRHPISRKDSMKLMITMIRKKETEKWM